MKKYIVFVLIIILVSCQSDKVSEMSTTVIQIGDRSEKGDLNEIASDIRLISLSLPDNVLFGNISSVKSSDGFLYLLDNTQTQTITVINPEGKYIRHLNEKGDSPQKYDVIHDFSIDRFNNELIVYDRNSSEFFFFDLNTFAFKRSSRISKNYVSFEVLNSDLLLTISDTKNQENEFFGVEVVDRNTFSQVDSPLRGLSNITIQASESISLYRSDDNKLYYYPPFVYTDVYQVSSNGFQSMLSVDFGSNKMEAELWDQRGGDFMKHLSKENKSTAAHYFIFEDDKVSFWYMKGSFRTRSLVKYNLDLSESTVYETLSYSALKEKLPPPSGVFTNRYIHLIYPDQIDYTFLDGNLDIQTNFKKEDIARIVESENPLILSYGLKLN